MREESRHPEQSPDSAQPATAPAAHDKRSAQESARIAALDTLEPRYLAGDSTVTRAPMTDEPTGTMPPPANTPPHPSGDHPGDNRSAEDSYRPYEQLPPGETVNPNKSLMLDPPELAIVVNSTAGSPLETHDTMGIRWSVSQATTDTDSDRMRRAALANAPSYRLDRMVGAGGMGEVWEATQESLGRQVAIKRIRPEDATGTRSAKQSQLISRSFHHEALITACLDHPNIVPVYDLGTDEKGQPLIAMKLVRGIPWEDLLRADKNVDFLERLSKHLPVLIDVAQAVAFAHSRGVIHRDLKPSQVMVGEFGEVLLLDWGVACYYTTGDHHETEGMFRAMLPNSAGVGEHGPTPLMQALNPAGTPAYMAPEQTESTTERLGTWTDVFLLGAVLYQLLTDEVPYPGRNATEAMQRAANYELKPPDQRVKDGRRLPPELVRVCLRAMSRNSWERHASVTELIEELRGFMTGFGKRRQSVEMTNEVMRRLGSEAEDYEGLQECQRLLVLARQQWDENPQLGELEAQVAERYARTALRLEDLSLAAMQAARVPDDKVRGELQAEVTRRKGLLARMKQQRKSLAIATMMLLLVSISCLLVALEVGRRGESPSGATTPSPSVASSTNATATESSAN